MCIRDRSKPYQPRNCCGRKADGRYWFSVLAINTASTGTFALTHWIMSRLGAQDTRGVTMTFTPSGANGASRAFPSPQRRAAIASAGVLTPVDEASTDPSGIQPTIAKPIDVATKSHGRGCGSSSCDRAANRPTEVCIVARVTLNSATPINAMTNTLRPSGLPSIGTSLQAHSPALLLGAVGLISNVSRLTSWVSLTAGEVTRARMLVMEGSICLLYTSPSHETP